VNDAREPRLSRVSVGNVAGAARGRRLWAVSALCADAVPVDPAGVLSTDAAAASRAGAGAASVSRSGCHLAGARRRGARADRGAPVAVDPVAARAARTHGGLMAKKRVVANLTIRIAETPGRCRWCGCTYERPCANGCGWANRAQTLCTECVPLDRAMRTARGRATLAAWLQDPDFAPDAWRQFLDRGGRKGG